MTSYECSEQVLKIQCLEDKIFELIGLQRTNIAYGRSYDETLDKYIHDLIDTMWHETEVLIAGTKNITFRKENNENL